MQQLTEKYRPKKLKDFAGLTRAKAIMAKLVGSPYSSAFLFTGSAGTGKTSLALAVADELHAQIIHIPSSECTVDQVRDLRDITRNGNMFAEWYLVLVDEADRMSPAAQVAFLSLLDATGFPEKTVFVFTSNTTKGLEARFLSRCRVIEFEGGADSVEVSNFLFGVWVKECGKFDNAPVMRDLILKNGGNIRGALMAMELELIVQEVAA